jgi:Ca-activated chloride channel family protein
MIPRLRRHLPALLFAALALASGARAQQPDAASQAPAVVTGRVTSMAGAPEAGVLIRIEAAGVGATSASDGMYRLIVPAARIPRGGQATLAASRVGLAPQSRTIALAAGTTVTQDFAMTADVLLLDELVATGTPTVTTRERLPSAVSTVQSTNIQPQGAPEPNAVAALAGRTQGITVTAAGTPSGSVVIRGAASVAPGRAYIGQAPGTEEYAVIDESGFRDAATAPLSTFAIDVDAASYANVRRFLTRGMLPPPDAVRIEEMVNYFEYDYPNPRGREPFAVVAEVAPAPWNPARRLVHVGIQGRRMDALELPPSNLVFLVDVSGSMQQPDKLPLVKRSLEMLVDELREEDRVALVVYAGAAGVVLEPTPGSDRARIRDAIQRLQAGGSTAGGEGLRLAYRLARESFRRGANNRVILATDGDFNVGVSSDAEMTRLVEEERGHGVFLTVLGFGMGNLKDAKMEALADHGNGNYAYVDGLAEARKVLVTEMGGTLVTLAKDVKVQVEFNPARVASYRLIGYENRALAAEDFNDDRKDAGELGAGHSVTALYEVVLAGADDPEAGSRVDPLRYQRRAAAGDEADLLTVKLRYKEPQGETSRLVERRVRDAGRGLEASSADFRFAAAVAGFGMLLRGSEHAGDASADGVLALARGAAGRDPHGYRAEFLELVRRWAELAPARAAVAH